MTVRILTSGDQALTVEFSDQIDETVNQRVAALAQSLATNPVAGIAEAVPTYRSRLVTYNSEQLRGAALSSLPVNTDRAGIAEEPAPVAAIAAGQVRAARLHVYSHDAPPGPLGATGQVIFTPHLGSATDEARRRVAAGAIGHVLPVLAGKRPATALNEPVCNIA